MPPALIAGAGIAATVLSTGVGLLGAESQAHAQQATANYQSQVATTNARIADQNREYAVAAGNAQAEQQMQRNAQTEGRLKAGLAASGFDINSGTAENLQRSQRLIGEEDVLNIQNNAARQAYGYQVQGTGYAAQSQLDTAAGQSYAQAGGINEGTTILSGARSLTGQYLAGDQSGALPGGSGLIVPGGGSPLGG